MMRSVTYGRWTPRATRPGVFLHGHDRIIVIAADDDDAGSTSRRRFRIFGD